MSSLGSPNPFFIAGKKAYEIERSIRNDQGTADVNSGSNFEHTYSSAGNQKTFTISVWVKKCNTPGNIGDGDDQYSIFSTGGGGSGAQNGNLLFYNDDSLYFVSQPQPSVNAQFITTRKFRDYSAWYHIVIAVDTTQATQSNRVKIYINGVQETSFTTETYPSQNADLQFNQAVRHRIGSNSLGSNLNSTYGNFNGYFADFNFLDGYAYDPSYFGETNSLTGQWNPKKYVGSYGTNGFYLNFSDNSGTTATTLGKDYSGNGNNFTPNNFSVSAGAGNDSVEDTPTNNFPTFNPLCENNDHTYSEGNLKVTYAANNQSGNVTSMASPKTGKWYWEVRPLNDYLFIGVTADTYQGTGNVINVANTVAYYSSGDKYVGGSSSTYNNQSFTNGDVIGVALDMDNGQVTFYKNNTSQGAISLVSTEGHLGIGAVGTGQSLSMSINFGQQAFTYTPPTGFKALNSANLPDPTILLPNKHFDTVTYTGSGSGNQSITSLNFQPDWVWIKARSVASYHVIADSVRGVGKLISSNGSEAESDDSTTQTAFSAFLSNGFTVGYNVAWYTNGSPSGAETQVAWNWNAGDTDGKTYTVTVVSDSGNKYRFDGFGTSAVTLDLAEGGTYIFNYPSAHPFRFSTTSDGTHGGGTEYTTGVTVLSSTSVQIVVAASAPTLYYYCSIHSGMGGQINTNSTLGSSNFDGSIQTTAKVNANAGFSIVTFSGSGNRTIGHGLGVAPQVIIMKGRNVSDQWTVGHQQLDASNPWHKGIPLNTTASTQDNATFWNDTAPTSTVFSKGTWDDGYNMVAYCFSEVAGYSKFGSYTGNGSNDGPFVYTGFRPAWVMIKNTEAGSTAWYILDNKRDSDNPAQQYLSAEDNAAEGTYIFYDFLSNGFKLRNTGSAQNPSGQKIIYLAFAESPFKNARAR